MAKRDRPGFLEKLAAKMLSFLIIFVLIVYGAWCVWRLVECRFQTESFLECLLVFLPGVFVIGLGMIGGFWGAIICIGNFVAWAKWAITTPTEKPEDFFNDEL